MTRQIQTAVVFILLAATSAHAADTAFYDRLLTRGIASLEAGNPEVASRELRIAAFGMIDQPERFETAHVYLTLAAARLEREADARQSAMRVASTDRLARKYATLALPAAVRKEFEAVAAKLLTSEQMSALLTAAPPESEAIVTPGVTIDPPQAPSQPPAPLVPDPASAATRKIRASEIPGRLNEADAALARNDLETSRRLYGEVLEAEVLDHVTALRLGEGLYRSRDFRGAVRAFARAGAPLQGEEHFRYYRAVAFYETGDYANARLELESALPHIEVTPDVASYRERIEAATAQ